MDGVLEGAAVLCVCKLACSLLVLPLLTATHSPVSFCCCCLLIFTDFLVTVFLSFLCICGSWLTELTLPGDVIALRFLLFLGHTYGAVLLLTTPLIAAETLGRLLWPGPATGEETEEERGDEGKDRGSSHAVGYFCCLSVWVVVGLNVRWRWRLEEDWAAACLHTTDSLVRCLPNMLSPVPSAVNPCWGMAFLSLLLILLTASTGLRWRRRAPPPPHPEDVKHLVPAPPEPGNPGMSRVDPEKTQSSCAAAHRACLWNIVQMSARRHGDFVLTSPGCLSAERGGGPLTFTEEEHADSGHRSRLGWWRRRGFPRPGASVMIGFVGVLSIFVLPLNLSVNVLLIRTVETLLELCVRSLLASTASADTPASHDETFV